MKRQTSLLIDTNLHAMIKQLAAAQGKKMTDLVNEALTQYALAHREVLQATINITTDEPLRSSYIELLQEEIESALNEIRDAIVRKAPPAYIAEKKSALLDLLRKNPSIPAELLPQIKETLVAIRTSTEASMG
jgi:hypothetical protein